MGKQPELRGYNGFITHTGRISKLGGGFGDEREKLVRGKLVQFVCLRSDSP